MSSFADVDHLKVPLSEILAATNNFDEKNFIAVGGFGSVYRGQSQKHGPIAVKRLSVGSHQGQHEFAMEIKLLSTYKHANLASLVGFCDQDGEKILVYKHESKGSLDKYLQSKDLDWIRRLHICLDAAHGLKYLHDDDRRVIHRDIKSPNILLNEDWKAKISDFGLSKINTLNGPLSILISNTCGTIGYIDPEYVTYSVLTENSDVYSFGVVLFEVLCGRPAQVVSYQDKHRFLCTLAQNHYQKGMLDEIIDPELRKQMNSASLRTFSTIAYQCLKCREDRPTMSRVVEQLQKALDYQLQASNRLGRNANIRLRDEKVSSNIVEPARLLASSSSSSHSTPVSSSLSWKYDVFMSFRGMDTRKTFVDHLYSALVQKGIVVYKDDEMLRRGQDIMSLLFNAIRESRIALIILTRNYANSRWCLNELTYVMENQHETGQIVIPIFFDIDPLEIRNQRGSFGEALAKHKSYIDENESWRKALRDVTDIAGGRRNDILNGSKFVKTIVDEISHRLLPSMSMPIVNKDLIGMKTRMVDLKSQLQVGVGGVRMVGICGTWGSGKSTLASSIYEEIHHEFEGCCFVKNVRADSRMQGLKTLQEHILSNVLVPIEVVLENIEDGLLMMESRLCDTSVLIVLDDVDHLDHLKMLVGSQHWFGEGSRLIITSRNEDLLNAHNMDIICDVRLLNEEEAIELFSRHAFGGRKAEEDYRKLSLNMISKFGGHPSQLISLGSFLNGKDMREWIRIASRLEEIPVHKIVNLFKTGDDGVERNIYSSLEL